LETGAAQRASVVIYDRADSSFATIPSGSMTGNLFLKSDWFHWTGITPAISKNSAEVCREAVYTAHEMGITVSTDLNYRAKIMEVGQTCRRSNE